MRFESEVMLKHLETRDVKSAPPLRPSRPHSALQLMRWARQPRIQDSRLPKTTNWLKPRTAWKNSERCLKDLGFNSLIQQKSQYHRRSLKALGSKSSLSAQVVPDGSAGQPLTLTDGRDTSRPFLWTSIVICHTGCKVKQKFQSSNFNLHLFCDDCFNVLIAFAR